MMNASVQEIEADLGTAALACRILTRTPTKSVPLPSPRFILPRGDSQRHCEQPGRIAWLYPPSSFRHATCPSSKPSSSPRHSHISNSRPRKRQQRGPWAIPHGLNARIAARWANRASPTGMRDCLCAWKGIATRQVCSWASASRHPRPTAGFAHGG